MKPNQARIRIEGPPLVVDWVVWLIRQGDPEAHATMPYHGSGPDLVVRHTMASHPGLPDSTPAVALPREAQPLEESVRARL